MNQRLLGIYANGVCDSYAHHVRNNQRNPYTCNA